MKYKYLGTSSRTVRLKSGEITVRQDSVIETDEKITHPLFEPVAEKRAGGRNVKTIK